MDRITYRYSPALDGVRGVFMMAFMLYHFGVKQIAGAWIGITLFFVLSAFLLTRNLAMETHRYGSPDMGNFYRRRAARLLPALTALLVAVGLYALFFSDRAKALGGDILATQGFAMNWRLLAVADEYFAQFADASPLRHAWTLAVEEQFYLVLPLLVWALIRVARSRRAQVALAAALAIAATLWTARIGFSGPHSLMRLYYGTDTRAAGLLVGVAGGLWAARSTPSDRPGHLPRAWVAPVGALGLAIVGASMMLISPESAWMWNAGGLTAFSLAALGLIVACIQPGESWLKRAFGWRPLVTLGKMSYGLYLAHWPVYLLVSSRLGSPWLAGGVSMAITIALAWASWTFLEQPVLRGGVASLRPVQWIRGQSRRTLVAGALPVVLATTLGVAAWRTAAPTGVLGPGVASQKSAAEIPDLVPAQPAYNADEVQRLLIIGDSVPMLLAEAYPPRAWPRLEVDTVAAPGCDTLTAPVEWVPGVLTSPKEDCLKAKADWPVRAREMKAQVLLVYPSGLLLFGHRIGGKSVDLRDQVVLDKLDEALNTVVRQAQVAGVQQVQLVALPCRPVTPESFGEAYENLRQKDPQTLKNFADPALLNQHLRQWAKPKGIPIIGMDKAFCSQGKVREPVPGVTMFRDFAHFSIDGSPILWKWLLGQVSEQYARR